MRPPDVELKREVVWWKKLLEEKKTTGNNKVKGGTWWILEENIVLKQKNTQVREFNLKKIGETFSAWYGRL